MRSISAKYTIKLTSILLVIIMIWQSVVWANPDIRGQNTLAPPPLVQIPESFFPAFALYLETALNRFEQDPKNHNIARMLQIVGGEIDKYGLGEGIPRLLLQELVSVDDKVHAGSFTINLGAYSIRYSFKEGDRIKGFPCERIGKYLYKQKITAMAKELEAFKRLTFMGEDPQKASAFFTQYKAYYERYRDLMKLNDEYNYVSTKLKWTWEMELVWRKAEDLARSSNTQDLKDKAHKMSAIVDELITKHNQFMARSGARCLQNDPYIEMAIRKAKSLAGIPPKEARPAVIKRQAEVEVEAAPEEKKTKPALKKKIKLSLCERLRFINWERMALILSLSLALSYLLYITLPRNNITHLIGFVAPNILLIYLLIKYRSSWRTILFIIGTSILLSIFLPVPWLGLSTAIVILSLMIYERRLKASTNVPKPPVERGGLKQMPEEAPREEAGPKDEKIGDGLVKPVKEIRISRDVLFYMRKIISILYKGEEAKGGKIPKGGKIQGKEKSKPTRGQAEAPDTKDILDAIFRPIASINIGVGDIEPFKDTLRPLVRQRLDELERGIDFSFHRESERLRNWKNENNEDLTKSLQEVAQEVIQSILIQPTSPNRTDEILAIQELVAEYYEIERERFRQIRLRLVLGVQQEQVLWAERIGIARPEEYYLLGRLEFYFDNYNQAEEAFSKAVALDLTNPDYYLTLGLVRHVIKKWASAKESYEHSIKFRESRAPFIEVDSLKIDLARLLIEKVENKVSLDGKKENGEGASQIGKLAEVRESTLRFINGAKVGWIGVYKKGTGEGAGEGLGDLELVKREEVNYTRMIRRQLPRNKAYRDIVLSMLGLLEKSPPSFYSYYALFEDLCGFALPEHNLIALNTYFMNNPVAVFHEVGEYLVSVREKMGTVPLGTVPIFSIRLDEKKLRIVIDDKEQAIALSDQTLHFIQEENWPEDWRSNQHYLLRVLQREIFGEKDKRLTAQIREAKILSARANRKAERSSRVFENYYLSLRAFVKKDAETDGITVISAASGPDIKDVYNATGFTKAYFIDKHRIDYAKLQEVYHGWDVIGYPHNFFQHRKTYGFVNSYDFQEDVAEIRIIQELKDLGINKDEVEIIAPTTDGQRLKLRFKLDNKWREIEFIQAYLPKIDKSLARELQGKADVYFQKASQDLPRRYSKYLSIAANWVKIGGVMMLNDCGEDGLFVNQDPQDYLSKNFIPVASEDLKKQEAKVYRYTRKNYVMAFYGWRMSVWEKRDVDLDMQGFDEETKDVIKKEVRELFRHFREEEAAAHILVRPYTFLNDFLTKQVIRPMLVRTMGCYILFFVIYCAIRLGIPGVAGFIGLALVSFGLAFLLNVMEFYKYTGDGGFRHTLWSEDLILVNKAYFGDNVKKVQEIIAHELGHLMIESPFFADAVRTIRKYERKNIDHFPEHREGVTETLDESGVEVVKILREDNGINDLVKELERVSIEDNPNGDQWWRREPDWAYDFGIMFGTAALKLVSDKLGKKVEDFSFDDYQAAYDFVRLVASGEGVEQALENSVQRTGYSVQDQDPSQMGKQARVESIQIKKAGEVKAKVKDMHENEYTLSLNPQGKLEIAKLKDYFVSMQGIEEGHRRFILTMLELIEHSPPGLYSYTTLIKDLFGFTSPTHNLVALHERLLPNLQKPDPIKIIALLHEIAHYLIDVKGPQAHKGLLDLKLIRSDDGKVFIKISMRTNFLVSFKEIAKLEINAETLKFIHEEEKWKNWEDNPHYLLRILQRIIFKDRDIELSGKIALVQKTTKRYRPATGQTSRIIRWGKIRKLLEELPLAEGHAHFGGSIHPETLWELALIRDDIDWTKMNEELTRIFSRRVDLNTILTEARTILAREQRTENREQIDTERLNQLKEAFFAVTQYRPRDKKGELKDFAIVYDIAAQLYKGERNVIKKVAKEIATKRYEEGLRLLEIRVSLPTGKNKRDLYAKTLEKMNAIIDGLKEAEREINSKLEPGKVGLETRIVATVERWNDIKLIQYQTSILLRVLEDYPDLREYIVGFDVANVEELKSPTQFVEIFKWIRAYNDRRGIKGEPKLGLTYHVGEGFDNVSIESAIRHVHEVIELGVERIGHGLVLGIDVNQFNGTTRREHITERIAQIYYDLRCARFDGEALTRSGLSIEEETLRKELAAYSDRYRYVKDILVPQLESILEKEELNREEEEAFYAALYKMKALPQYSEASVTIEYDTARCSELEKRQNYVLNKIIEKGIVIETNPTSNVYIGPIAGYGQHPIKKFLSYRHPTENTKVVATVNTDDAGIFGTTLTKEYTEIIKALDLTEDDVRELIINGFRHRLSHHPLRFQKEIMASLGPLVQKELAGYQIVNTKFGDIQFTIPSETIRDIVRSYSAKKNFPTTFVLPPNVVVKGYNYADIASVICFFAFAVRNGLKINIVLDPKQEPVLRDYLEHIIFGIDFNSSKWQEYRKKWISALGEERAGDIEKIEKHIQTTQDIFRGRTNDGRTQNLDDYVRFYTFKDDKVEVEMVDGYHPKIVLGKIEIERGKTNKSHFIVREIIQTQDAMRLTSPQEIELDYRRPPVLHREIPQDIKKKFWASSRPRFGYTVLSRNYGFDAGGEGSSFIMWVGGKGILVDPSDSAIRMIEELGLTKDDIPYVLLTSNHAGNDRGLLKWLFTGKRVKILTSYPVYFSFREKASNLLGEDVEKAGYYEFVPLMDNQENEIVFSEKEKASIKIRHNFYSIPAIGFIISYRHKGRTYKIGFSGDNLYDPKRIVNGGSELLHFFWNKDGILHSGIEVVLHQTELRERDEFGIHTPIDALMELPGWTREKIVPYHMPEASFPIRGFRNTGPLETVAILESDEKLQMSYYLETIRQVALLADLGEGKITKLLEEGKLLEFAPGEELMKEGDDSKLSDIGFAIILDGGAAITKGGIVLTKIERGTCVGEWGLEMNEARGATIRAAKDGARALVFTPEQYARLISSPEIRTKIIRIKENLPFFQKVARSTKLENNPFSELDYNALVYLAVNAEPMLVQDGKTITRQGEKSDSLYLVRKGVVRVMRGAKVSYIFKGDYFGTHALLSPDGISAATITAEGDVELVRLSKGDFDKIRQEWPYFDREIRKEAERRLRSASQMGKRAEIVSVVIATPSEARGKQSQEEIASLTSFARNDKFIAKVRDSKGRMHSLTLEPKGKVSIDWLKSGSEFLKGMKEGHKEIVLSMLELLESSPPRLYTYNTLIEDLFGFPSTEHNFIALHEKVAYNPLAEFHEILEYLIDKGLIQLEFKEETPSWVKRVTLLYRLFKWIGLVSGRIMIKGKFGIVIGEVTVRRSALSIALKDIQNKHYLIRALQRSIFGRQDKELTNKIKWYQRLNSVGLLNVYERLKYEGYKVIGVDTDLRMASKLKELTGVNFLANHKTVYSPLLNNSLSINFAETAIKEANRVAASIKSQGRKDMRILVIGSGTGIDAMAAFYHAKVKNGIENVHVDAIDIDKDAVRNTAWNIKLAGKAYEEAIHPRLVKEGREFDGLEGPYDLILFNAPNAVQLAPGEYSSAAYMDENVFIGIMRKIKEYLSPTGAAVIENFYDVMSKRSGLMPKELDGTVIFRQIAWLLPVERAIFKFTLKQPPVVASPNEISTSVIARPKGPKQSQYRARENTEDERIKAIAANLVNALIVASEKALEKKEKVLLALDTDLGEGEINRLLQDLIKVIPTLEDNNKDLKEFLANLIIIKGAGRELGARFDKITSIKKENIILVTKNKNFEEGYFDSIEDVATIASINDTDFPATEYLPLVEVILFAVSKYLNWPQETLRKNYALIPHVVAVGDLDRKDRKMLFGKDAKTLVIRLIPPAEPLKPGELAAMMARVKDILKKA